MVLCYGSPHRLRQCSLFQCPALVFFPCNPGFSVAPNSPSRQSKGALARAPTSLLFLPADKGRQGQEETSVSTQGSGGDVQPEKVRGEEDLLCKDTDEEGTDGEASPEDHLSLSWECGVWAASLCSGDRGGPPGQDKPS